MEGKEMFAMKIKCTEDRQEDAILVEKLKNDSRYTEAKTELSKFCRDLGKTNLRVPCVKTAESFKCLLERHLGFTLSQIKTKRPIFYPNVQLEGTQLSWGCGEIDTA